MVNSMEDMNLYNVKFKREDCVLLISIPDLRKWLTQQYSLALFNVMTRLKDLGYVNTEIARKKKMAFKEIMEMCKFDKNAVYYYNLVVPTEEQIESIQEFNTGNYIFK